MHDLRERLRRDLHIQTMRVRVCRRRNRRRREVIIAWRLLATSAALALHVHQLLVDFFIHQVVGGKVPVLRGLINNIREVALVEALDGQLLKTRVMALALT